MTMITGIAAVARNGAIGKGGQMPWHYSADMRFFRETTTGHVVVMGRKTWSALGKPLKNRINVVMARDKFLEVPDGVEVHHSVDDVLKKFAASEMFVIGGSQIYSLFKNHIQRWLITEVPLTVEDADTFMPENYLEGFVEVESRKLDDELVLKTYRRGAEI